MENDLCAQKSDDTMLLLGRHFQIEELILFRWNRVYPADLHCTLDLSVWKLTETEEFAGNSHEKITQERYVRE